jgi:hypothetical protein
MRAHRTPHPFRSAPALTSRSLPLRPRQWEKRRGMKTHRTLHFLRSARVLAPRSLPFPHVSGGKGPGDEGSPNSSPPPQRPRTHFPLPPLRPRQWEKRRGMKTHRTLHFLRSARALTPPLPFPHLSGGRGRGMRAHPQLSPLQLPSSPPNSRIFQRQCRSTGRQRPMANSQRPFSPLIILPRACYGGKGEVCPAGSAPPDSPTKHTRICASE